MNFKIAVISLIRDGRKERTLRFMSELAEVSEPPFIISYEPTYGTILIEVPDIAVKTMTGDWATFGMYLKEIPDYRIGNISIFMPYYGEIQVLLSKMGVMIR